MFLPYKEHGHCFLLSQSHIQNPATVITHYSTKCVLIQHFKKSNTQYFILFDKNYSDQLFWELTELFKNEFMKMNIFSGNQCVWSWELQTELRSQKALRQTCTLLVLVFSLDLLTRKKYVTFSSNEHESIWLSILKWMQVNNVTALTALCSLRIDTDNDTHPCY